MNSLKLILPALVIVFIVYLGLLSWLTRHTPIRNEAPSNLAACPNKPNCVSSLDQSPGHGVAPLRMTGGGSQDDWRRLLTVIREMGGEITFADSQYAHAVFTSALFRFKDDLEVLMREETIDIRSASRAGTSDLGVNRKRVEEIRRRYSVAEQKKTG